MGQWKHRVSQVNETTKMAVCAGCGPVKVRWKGGRWVCTTPKWLADGTKVDVQLGPACQVCGNTNELVRDHDHETRTFRGTLCRSCNLGLGYFQDSPHRLQAALAYLG